MSPPTTSTAAIAKKAITCFDGRFPPVPPNEGCGGFSRPGSASFGGSGRPPLGPRRKVYPLQVSQGMSTARPGLEAAPAVRAHDVPPRLSPKLALLRPPAAGNRRRNECRRLAAHFGEPIASSHREGRSIVASMRRPPEQGSPEYYV